MNTPKSEPAPQIQVIDTACKWTDKIMLHGDDYKLMDIRTLRVIDSHNRAWEKNCGATK